MSIFLINEITASDAGPDIIRSHLSSTLSIYNTLIDVVLREYDTAFLVGFYYLIFSMMDRQYMAEILLKRR